MKNTTTQSTNSSLLTQDEVLYTMFEPKVECRFICRVKDKSGEQFIPAYIIKRVERPHVIRLENGKWKWLPIEIETYDPIVPSAAQIFARYIELNKETFDMKIEILGPVGDSIEMWEFTNARIIEVNFGSLDWDNYPTDKKSKIEGLNITRHYKGGDIATIRAKIEYKSAKLVY